MYGYEILHDEIVDNLINNIRSGKAQHAYIFEGENGVGNFEAAKLFANSLVCEKQEKSPCTTCNACVMAKAGTHPDIYYITPPKNKKNIIVDQIRDVVNDAYTKPYESAKKVYVIKSGNKMNEQAQNAFLKVLEEPPQYAVFIILVENHETLLQTILSRCTLIKFNTVSSDKIKEYIKKHYPDQQDNIEFLTRYSNGVVGNVAKIIEQDNFIPLRNRAFDKLENLLSQNLLDAYSISDFLDENKDDADLILRFWLDFVRDILLIQNDSRELILNSDLVDKLINFSNRIDERRTIRATEELILAQKMRNKYVSLHILALKLAFSIKKH